MKQTITNFVLALFTLGSLLFGHQITRAQCHIDDWTALKALYEATDSSKWKNKEGWEMVKSDEPSADCNLDNLWGVFLNGTGRVDSLNLSHNCLYGYMPVELDKLKDLEILNLSNNALKGVLPPELGNLKKLLKLQLNQNGFYGSIPIQLGDLTNLTNLDLSYNGLLGIIPPELGNLTNLLQLKLDGNKFTDNIPAEFGNLSKLTLLDLGLNDLSGNIPAEIGNLSNLTFLSLSKNELNGNIPLEIGNLTNLKRLYLQNNKLEGSIPSQFGNLNSLVGLYLYENQLNGSIPTQIGNIDSLKILMLNDNKLNGNIPAELGNLSGLETLDLKNNLLSGNIPFELGNLKNLIVLYLYNNQLSGSIPPKLGGLNSLEKLLLQNNKLSSIPPELGNLINLEQLKLYNNQLSGSIPPELGNLVNLKYLMLQNNKLSGSIPLELRNANKLSTLNLSNNQLSGAIPEFKEADFVHYFYFDFRFNNFNCGDIENRLFDFFFKDYDYTPQNYQHNAKQNFLIDNSNESVTLSAPINQNKSFLYQWYKDEKPIEDATDSILHLNNIQFEDVGNYKLHILDFACMGTRGITYVSDPISVRRRDLEGCTDEYSCTYNEFAIIDDGSCEYLSCDTLTNAIKIKTTNETILSEEQISFDLVIDSLGQDYSADGLTFTLDTRGNYSIDSVEVINSVLSIGEVDVSQLYSNTLAIDRTNSELLPGNTPLLRVVASIVVEDIPTDEHTCSLLSISGGTELASGYFISFDNIYIDVPFSDCSPYGGYGAEGGNWLPLVLTTSPQNCRTNTTGSAEIKILQDGQAPYTYTLKNENGIVVVDNLSTEHLIKISELDAGNYDLEVLDSNGKITIINTTIPLIANLNGNENCINTCVDYVTVPNGYITGEHYAKKEIDIKGYVGKNETVEFKICD